MHKKFTLVFSIFFAAISFVFGQGATNQWSASLQSVVDNCNSITFSIRVTSPSTSRDLSHVTFGFPVNTSSRNKNPGSTAWSYGQDGSYNQGDLPGINAPFIGIKDDAGGNKGTTYTYTFTFSGADYTTVKNWVNSSSNLVVLMKAGSSPNGGFTSLVVDPVITTPCVPPCVPPAVAALTGNNSVCVGTGTTFSTSTAGGTFESSNPFVATVHPTTGVITTLNAGSSEIRYTVTSAPGCATTVTRLLTVNAIPAKPTITASVPNICNGNPTILTATSAASGSTYRWYLNNTLINGQSAATLSVTTPGSYSVEIVSPATCASERSDVTVLTALSTPTLNGAITGNNTVCEGASTTLSHATAGGTWSSSDPTIASVSSAGVVTGVAGGAVTITYTVSNACGSNSVTFPMTVNPLPAQPAVITGNTQICINGTTTLASATAGGVWSSTNTYLATVNPTTGVVTGHVGGTLNIVYTVTNSCGSSTRQVSVTISAAPPTPDAIQGVATVCAGSTTTYTSATAGATWSSSNNAVATVNAATGVVTGVSNGTAIITYTVNGTCGSSQVTKLISVTNCGGGGGNQNEWSATLDSVVDLCDSIRFVLTVKSPSTSKDLSHVTFGFPVNTNNKTRGAGTATWSFGQDGSYNTGDISGVNAPFIGIKDDTGGDAGVTLTYTFTFSGADYSRMLNWVLSDTNLVVLMKAGATPNGGFTALILDPSVTQGCGVSGGSGGGIESYSLGEVIGKRNMAKAKAGQLGETNYGATPKWDGPVSNDRGGIQMQGTNMRLRDLIPSQVPGLQAFVTSPTDLTQFTNAVEVMSVDFTRSNIARAVTFATKTMDEVYNHTKPICDRLRGAQLLDVQKVTLANNVDMLSYTIRQANGKVEYAVSFSAGAKNGRNNLNIESKWFTKDYVNDEVMYNFQVWAETPALMRSLTEDILSRLSSNGVLVQARNNAVVPEVYVVSGVRTGGKLILTIENRTPNSNGYFELDEKLNEQASVTKRRVPFTINQQGRSTLEIEMRDGFESDVRMFINGEITDLVYMSDGIWGLDYNRNQTTIRSFRVTNDPARVYKDEYPLFRDIQIEGTTSDYITAYKFLRGAALPTNISAYKSLRFEASGGHKLKITLVKEGIAQWNDQYTYTLQLDPQKKEYQISLADFASKGVAGKIRANDVTTVVFSIEATEANTAVNARIGKVGFTKTDVDYLRSLEAKDVQLFPNPSEGRFTIQFRSPVEMPLTVKLTDAATGRPVMSRAIQAIQGENQVTMEMNAQKRSQGVYIVHLEGANGVRYKPAKLSVTSKNR